MFMRASFILFLWSLVGCGPAQSLNHNNKLEPIDGGDCKNLGTLISMKDYGGHTVPVISARMITEKRPNIFILGRGNAGHEHVFTLSENDFNTLQGNTGVVVRTTPDETGHTHQLLINCEYRQDPTKTPPK